ncbi:MAG: ATP-binding cassette domain-containing protein [Actinobacteria bacterium]|nr:ATP-binding cassette domain-containing protein [Actinomycetota bacterium]
MTNKLTLTEVTKHFGTNRVLDQLSISIAPGEVVSFIGASGSGKTTSCAASTCWRRSTTAPSTWMISKSHASAWTPTRSVAVSASSSKLQSVPAHERAAQHHARPHRGARSLTRRSRVERTNVARAFRPRRQARVIP